MLLKEVLDWLKNEFGQSVPDDYLSFLKQGDFKTTLRKNYIFKNATEDFLEISQWFTYDNLSFVYNNSLEEDIIEKFHLPIFDSCNMVVVINCNLESEYYGHIFVKDTEGLYDLDLNKDVNEFKFVTSSFSEIIKNLKSTEDLENLGLL